MVNQTNVSTAPEGLVVALNSPPESNSHGVLVNYVSPYGNTTRTLLIPNVQPTTAEFQVVQDDVYVYTDLGDEPGLRRLSEDGSLSAGRLIQPGVPMSHFWLVSPDGGRVSWGETLVQTDGVTSTLWVDDISGTEPQAMYSAQPLDDLYVKPVAWVLAGDEPQVWYSSHPSRIYNQSGQEIVGAPLVFGDVSQDGSVLIILKQQDDRWFVQAGQEQHLLSAVEQPGTVSLSPEGTQVAVAMSSWIEIWNISSDTTTRIPNPIPARELDILDWLDTDTVALYWIHPDDVYQSEVYVVQNDGSFFRQIWTGYPIGVIQQWRSIYNSSNNPWREWMI